MRSLILGCGKRHEKREGETTLDIRNFPGVDVVHDLNKVPWPFDANVFAHVSAVHLVEHLQNLVSFMNECWRILQPGGSLYLETPLAGSDPDLEFSDPTHVRCYRVHTFVNYFTIEGIERFGYTDRAWAPVVCEERPHGILRFHGFPIKRAAVAQ